VTIAEGLKGDLIIPQGRNHFLIRTSKRQQWQVQLCKSDCCKCTEQKEIATLLVDLMNREIKGMEE
jgi:uncharacterized protein YggL (DUF469 family)